eukprot:11183462-Lingulodinium_polyedra.AAC.1
MKRTIFCCRALGTLLSGMEARVLLEGETNRMEALLMDLARKALRGSASKTDEFGQKRTPCNAQVRKLFRVARVTTELLIRRLHWWQCMADCPQRHAQCLAALLGQCKFEAEPPLNGQGRPSAWASPWLLQLNADIHALCGNEVGAELQHVFNGNLIELFTPGTESNRAFTYISKDAFAAFRAADICVAIPPPGTVIAEQ